MLRPRSTESIVVNFKHTDNIALAKSYAIYKLV